MAMSVGSDKDDEIMNEINTTPLVDVMLVLLIIFLITIPVVTTSIKVDLPKEKNMVRETKPENVIISVDVKGKIFLYDTPIKNSDDLLQRMKKFSVMKPQPEVQIRGDGKSDFESVGRVMYAVQRAGITNVDVVHADAAAEGFRACETDAPFDVIVLGGSVAEVPPYLLNLLRVGGRLVGIVGNEPMMRATLVTRASEQAFTTEQPWDYVAPRLVHFPQADAFRF